MSLTFIKAHIRIFFFSDSILSYTYMLYFIIGAIYFTPILPSEFPCPCVDGGGGVGVEAIIRCFCFGVCLFVFHEKDSHSVALAGLKCIICTLGWSPAHKGKLLLPPMCRDSLCAPPHQRVSSYSNGTLKYYRIHLYIFGMCI